MKKLEEIYNIFIINVKNVVQLKKSLMIKLIPLT